MSTSSCNGLLLRRLNDPRSADKEHLLLGLLNEDNGLSVILLPVTINSIQVFQSPYILLIINLCVSVHRRAFSLIHFWNKPRLLVIHEVPVQVIATPPKLEVLSVHRLSVHFGSKVT